MNPALTLETGRLNLRRVTLDDVELMKHEIRQLRPVLVRQKHRRVLGGPADTDHRIAWVGPTAEGPDRYLGDGYAVVDATGQTVMPGLVDVHVHFDIIGHSDYDKWFGTYESRMRSDIMPSAAKAMLYAGVTTVRDGEISPALVS